MRFFSRDSRRVLWIILAVALAARLLLGIFFVGLGAPPAGDAAAYNQIARNLVYEGRYIQYHQKGTWLAVRAPLLPFILAGLYSIVGYSFVASRLLMIVIGSFAPLVIYAVGGRLFGRKTAILAGFISAVYPSFILYSNTLHTEGLLVPLFSLVILFLIRFAQDRRARDIVVAGIMAGLACLCRPTILALLPVFAIWVLIVARRDLWLSLRSAAMFLVLAALVIAPWTYRNYTVFGRLIPICSRGGVSLWLGNNQWATGNLGVDNERLVKIMPDTGTDDEVESARYFQREALKYIRTHPKRSLVLAAKKVFHFWRPEGFRFPGLVDQTPAMVRFVIGFFSYMPLFVLFVVGCAMAFKRLRLFRDPGLLLLTFIVVAFTGIHAVFPSMPRYRQPIEPIIIIVASWALVRIVERLISKPLPEPASKLA